MSDFTSEYVEGLSRRAHKAEAAIARVQELCTESWAGKLAYDARMNVIRALEGEQT